jgi:hypothetical protein
MFILLLPSCGDKDDDKKDERSPRLRQMSIRYVVDNFQIDYTVSTMFLYNNDNQLIAMVGIASDDSIVIQYDSEGRIREAVFYDSEVDYNHFVYSWSGNIVTVMEADNTDVKAVFEIDNNGRVVRMEYYVLNENQWLMSYFVLYNWVEDNLVSTETWDSYAKSGTHPGGAHHLPFMFPELQKPASNKELLSLLKQDFTKVSDEFYTYDDKINPFKDFQIYKYTDGFPSNSLNNIVASVSNIYNNSGEIESTNNYSYSYTYSNNNYPLVSSSMFANRSVTSTFIYE